MLWMSLTSGGTEAWISTWTKIKHMQRGHFASSIKTNKHHCLGWYQVLTVALSPIPQSRLHGWVLHMTQSTSTQGSLLSIELRFLNLNTSLPAAMTAALCKGQTKYLQSGSRRIYHRARSPFTCALHSSRSFQHLRISKGVTQQCCVV